MSLEAPLTGSSTRSVRRDSASALSPRRRPSSFIASGFDVPVREDPLGVAHEQANAVEPVALGEEEALLLEHPLRQLARQVLRRADLVFFAEARNGRRTADVLQRLLAPAFAHGRPRASTPPAGRGTRCRLRGGLGRRGELRHDGGLPEPSAVAVRGRRRSSGCGSWRSPPPSERRASRRRFEAGFAVGFATAGAATGFAAAFAGRAGFGASTAFTFRAAPAAFALREVLGVGLRAGGYGLRGLAGRPRLPGCLLLAAGHRRPVYP